MLALAAPVLAQSSPAPSDAEVATELSRLGSDADNAQRLARADRLLARLDRPTPARALVQTARASILLYTPDRMDDAQVAIEEALRLFPDQPMTQRIGAELFTYRNDPGRAADLWMALSRSAPALAIDYDVYNLETLLERLVTDRQADKADALIARMVAIGHPGVDTALRTGAAVARVRRLIDKGDVAGASEAMRSVVGFGSFLTLYLDRKYEAIWPAMDRWTGGNLARQREASLLSYRADWKRGGIKRASRYASALPTPESWDAQVELFAPLLAGPFEDGLDSFYAATLAVPVSQALIGLGRPDEAVALLAGMADDFDADNPAPGLTSLANLANSQLMLGRFQEAVRSTDRFRELAKSLDGGGNPSGLAATEIIRACALVGVGQELEAVRTVAQMPYSFNAVPPGVAWDWYSCHNDGNAARHLVLDSLKDDERRSWALGLLQPNFDTLPTDWSRERLTFKQTIRADPEVRAAAQIVGRLLEDDPWGGMPAGFDPKG